MSQFDCEFKKLFVAAIPHISHDCQVAIKGNLPGTYPL
jgi:hypothetical protein